MTGAQETAIARACRHENLMREALDALRDYMDAVRFAQDRQALIGALREADEKARAVLARVPQEIGNA
ncbi:hypothetical protein LMG19282_04218 [Cupriavidus campinensis]|nr:hypothetical protein LMG19282_04218 [Cupriavidus campinensis]